MFCSTILYKNAIEIELFMIFILPVLKMIISLHPMLMYKQWAI